MQAMQQDRPQKTSVEQEPRTMADTHGPITPDEPARLERLRSYSILDTMREPIFDRLVFIAAQTFRTPIAMLTLVDERRQWSKAHVGTFPTEIPRMLSFCTQTILSSDALVIDDATQDARFRHNPLVTGPPYVRFYAGAPLIAPDGSRIGCLCVMDRTPRSIMPNQVWSLTLMAREAMDTIEGRQTPPGQ
jgi:GAF domain-containing protein